MTHPGEKSPLEEKIKKLVEDSLRDNESISDIIPTKVQEKVTTKSDYSFKEPTTKKLDVEDTLRMENLLLRKQIEGLTKQLEEFRRNKAEADLKEQHKGLQEFLTDKHKIDTELFKLTLDPNSYTLTVHPLNVATDNKGS